MEYDPIKEKLGYFFNKSPFYRKTFYNLLDLLLLRAWHVHKALKTWIKEYPKGADILDAGSGFGQYSYWLAKQNKNYNILAVDVKEEQVEDCNQFFHKIGLDNVEFEVQDLTKFQNPNAYDLIVSVDVMEHILEDVEVFKNFHASLKKGGMVLINTPSDQGGSDVDEVDGTSFIGEHVRNGYNIQEIQDKLRSAGFTKIEAQYTYGKTGSFSWKLSMKYPMLLLNKSMLGIILLPAYYLVTFPLSYVLNYADVHSGKHKTGTGLLVKAWK